MNDRPLLPARRRLATGAAAAVALGALGTAGCASIEPAQYAAEKPVLELQRYFTGTVDGWGMVQDRSGKVLRRFTVEIRCTWNGDTGTLDEDFVWSDGEKQKRIWTIRRLGPGRYAGTAADVVGEATGIAAGNALNWRYVLALPYGGRTINLDLDDWMYLVDENTLLNRATMSFWGFRVGEITISFTRRPAGR